MSPEIVCFFDDETNSASYVVHDPETMQNVAKWPPTNAGRSKSTENQGKTQQIVTKPMQNAAKATHNHCRTLIL